MKESVTTLRNSALIVVDMQNAFLSTEGSIASMGIPIDRAAAVVPGVKQLIDLYRKKEFPVIYTMMTMQPDFSDAGVLETTFPPLKGLGHCIRNTRDWEIVDPLRPEPDDHIIEKHRFSGFYDTRLESLLRCLGITTLVYCGVATNICVESTVRDGFYRDFQSIVVRDATASYTEEMERGSMINFEFGFADLATIEEISAGL